MYGKVTNSAYFSRRHDLSLDNRLAVKKHNITFFGGFMFLRFCVWVLFFCLGYWKKKNKLAVTYMVAYISVNPGNMNSLKIGPLCLSCTNLYTTRVSYQKLRSRSELKNCQEEEEIFACQSEVHLSAAIIMSYRFSLSLSLFLFLTPVLPNWPTIHVTPVKNSSETFMSKIEQYVLYDLFNKPKHFKCWHLEIPFVVQNARMTT
jgi:hypothetical protein